MRLLDHRERVLGWLYGNKRTHHNFNQISSLGSDMDEEVLRTPTDKCSYHRFIYLESTDCLL